MVFWGIALLLWDISPASKCFIVIHSVKINKWIGKEREGELELECVLFITNGGVDESAEVNF